MGSLRKRLRQLKDDHLTLSDIGSVVAAALECKGKPPVPQYLTRRIVHGWEVFLSVFDHPMAEGDDAPVAEHWHCSCQLWPKNRRSYNEDWEMLGRLTHALAVASGMPHDSTVRELTDIRTTHPAGVHHFLWHTDGADCVILPALRRSLN